MTFDTIQVEMHDRVGIIRLNDPAALNAISARMVEEIDAALDQLVGSVRAIVVTGAGRAFSAGANLAGGMGDDVPRQESDFGLSLETHINPLMSRLRDLPIPWISAVRGAAAGVGCSLALAADMVIASDTAYFLQAFSRIGIVPDGGSTHLLTRAVGRVRALEMMLLGERVAAAQALDWGLVSRVIPDKQLDEVALEFAQRLAAGPTVALGMIRRMAWNALDSDWETVLRTEREQQRLAGRTLDAEEGVAAFLTKRPAAFTGA